MIYLPNVDGVCGYSIGEAGCFLREGARLFMRGFYFGEFHTDPFNSDNMTWTPSSMRGFYFEAQFILNFFLFELKYKMLIFLNYVK